MPSSIHFIYASTSGNTEFVVDEVVKQLSSKLPDVSVECQRAEAASPEDLLRGDVLILGSGTWNTGGTEGQLNMHMDAFLKERAKDIDLRGKKISFISLGDERYYFRTRCTEHFLRFQREHGGALLLSPLVIVNEPFEQVDKIRIWADKLISAIRANDNPALSL